MLVDIGRDLMLTTPWVQTARVTRASRNAAVAAMIALSLMMRGANPVAAAQAPLCPHTESRLVYQDNAVAYDSKTKSFLHTSLVAATVMKADETTVGFAYLDDAGNVWVQILPQAADRRTREYFGVGNSPAVVPAAALPHPRFAPFPPWIRLAACPLP
jgi:hypothetical protein